MIHEGPKLKWTPEREKAFESLKELAAENNPLEFIDEDKPLNVAMDACKEGWGAILFQLDENGKKSIVGIASGTFNATERNWSTNEQEAKAILNGLQAFSNHLLGTHFNMFTDHKNLTYITDRLLRAESTTLAQQGACYDLLITGPKYVTQEPPSIFTSIRIIDLTIRPCSCSCYPCNR
jgi:hypothetical protein